MEIIDKDNDVQFGEGDAAPNEVSPSPKSNEGQSSDASEQGHGRADIPADGGHMGLGAPKYAIWLDMLTLIGVFIVANLLGVLVKTVVTRWAGAEPGFGTFVSYVTTFVLTIGFALWQRKWRSPGKKYRKVAKKRDAQPEKKIVWMVWGGLWVLWGIVLVIATSMVIEPIVMLFPAENLEMLSKAIGTGGWAILTSVVAAPIFEEVLFRGIVQRSLMERIGQFRGIIVAAAIFGIVHLIPQQIINAFFIGIILGFIYVRTRSVIPVILIHVFNNALAFIQMSLGDGTQMTTRELIGNDTVYWIVYGLCCALLIFMVATIAFVQQMAESSAGEGEEHGVW